MDPILEVKNLRTVFDTSAGTIAAADSISFTVGEKQTLGLVGESGSGKSVTSLSIMQLVPCPPGRYESGAILFKGKNILDLSAEEICAVRGKDIAMIFQEPMTSLNPVHKIGKQLIEIIRIHNKNVDNKKAFDQAVSMLTKVGIPVPSRRMNQYPHELSGGMRQRVMIAMSLLNKPKLLIADEPTTALDVTIQAQILRLMKDIQKEMGMSILMITHDLGVVAETCDYVCVMYAGQIVEKGPVEAIFESPAHPYTEGLLNSIPKPLIQGDRESRLHDRASGGKKPRFKEIPGMVPELNNLPKGCRFVDRCLYAQDKCRQQAPPNINVTSQEKAGSENAKNEAGLRQVLCHFPLKDKLQDKQP